MLPMPPNVHLWIVLPKNRDHAGWIRVVVKGVPKKSFPILGRGTKTFKTKAGQTKSTHNPHLSPFLWAGNTPTGDYVATGIVDTHEWSQHSYGPWGAIRLKAVAGDALLATDNYHRYGFLIHAGDSGQFDGLRPTCGCLRLSNQDMRQLVQLISGAGYDAMACRDVVVEVTVREF